MWVGGSIKSFIIASTPPPVSTIPRGRQPGAARPAAGAGGGQLPRHVLASDRAGSEQLGAKCMIEKSYRHLKAHNFALS